MLLWKKQAFFFLFGSPCMDHWNQNSQQVFSPCNCICISTSVWVSSLLSWGWLFFRISCLFRKIFEVFIFVKVWFYAIVIGKASSMRIAGQDSGFCVLVFCFHRKGCLNGNQKIQVLFFFLRELELISCCDLWSAILRELGNGLTFCWYVLGTMVDLVLGNQGIRWKDLLSSATRSSLFWYQPSKI